MESSQWRKYRPHLINLGLAAVLIALLYFVGEVVIPFLIGLAGAYLLNPVVRKVQQKIPNRELAVTVVLGLSLLLVVGMGVFFGTQIFKDFERLNDAIVRYAEDNSESIDASTQQIKEYLDQLYSPEELQEKMGLNTDSLDTEALMEQVDTDALGSSLEKVAAFFSSESDETTPDKSMNWLVIFFSSIAYFLYIIYTYGYFETKFQKYFGGESQGVGAQLFSTFKSTFLSYFKQRSIVVGIYIVLFAIAFMLIGVPGAILFAVLAGLLCYIAYFQYIMLLPLAMGCVVLAIERDQSFFLFFGIILGVFILLSVLEELVLFPYVMKDVATMNPAIMMAALAVWTYLLGTLGLLIGLPLTSLCLIYLDKILLERTK